jgi:hypothetical protein
VLNQLSNRDKHRLLVPFIAAVSETDIWVASANADIHFQWIETAPVEHDAEIVRFTARPKGRPNEMKVHPQSGLEIQISSKRSTTTSVTRSSGSGLSTTTCRPPKTT